MSWNDEVVEPTEIIVEEPSIDKKKSRTIFPWVRLFARLFDYSILFFVAKRLFPALTGASWGYIPVLYFLWIPVEAGFIHLWGSTPGKWLFSIKVMNAHGKKLFYENAIRRSFSVWFRGLAMGIPVISFFAIFFAYSRLVRHGICSWDRDEKCKILHKKIPTSRFIIAAVILVLIWSIR